MKRIPAVVLVAALVAGWAVQTNAYVRSSGKPKWTNAKVTMYLQVGTTARSLIDGSSTWNKAVSPALSQWNAKMLRMQFAASSSNVAKGFANGRNNVFFASKIYNSSFGSSTLAVCMYTYFVSSRAMYETDVIFNTKWKWNSYRGNLRPWRTTGFDIRRVAIHEFGHALGLGHSSASTAIMRPFVGNQDRIGTDDIKGAQAIYGAR